MATHDRTSFEAAELVQTAHEDRQERARIVASLAEYLAADLNGQPERALEAMSSLAEWCDGDTELLAEARADVLRDTASAVEASREAVQLLQLVAEAS